MKKRKLLELMDKAARVIASQQAQIDYLDKLIDKAMDRIIALEERHEDTCGSMSTQAQEIEDLRAKVQSNDAKIDLLAADARTTVDKLKNQAEDINILRVRVHSNASSLNMASKEIHDFGVRLAKLEAAAAQVETSATTHDPITGPGNSLSRCPVCGAKPAYNLDSLTNQISITCGNRNCQLNAIGRGNSFEKAAAAWEYIAECKVGPV